MAASPLNSELRLCEASEGGKDEGRGSAHPGVCSVGTVMLEDEKDDAAEKGQDPSRHDRRKERELAPEANGAHAMALCLASRKARQKQRSTVGGGRVWG